MALDTSKIIHAPVGGGRYTVTSPIVKEDYGLYLKIEGLELPSTYEVDFSNSEHNGTSVTMIGNADGVLIPRQFITTGKDVFAFLYHVGADFGRTVYKFRIPNKLRPDRTNEEPTPEEQSVIDQAIAALNDAVEQTAQDVIDADQSAQEAAESAQASGESALSASNSALSSGEYASNALGYAESASASATASAQSASQSAQIKADVEDLAEEAQASASASAQSATASANSASQASGYAQSASASAQSASSYASSAQTSAQTASSKASEASTSASTASAKASESAQSASQALTYKNDAEQAKTASQTAQGKAEDAQTAAETAQGLAEDARDEAQSLVDGISGKVEQIDSNTERIESLEEDRYKPYPTDTASGAIASFSDGADRIPLKSLIVSIDPVQDISSGDPSPENICPISGWTGCEVSATGYNVWDEQWESGGLGYGKPATSAGRIRSKNYIVCKPNTTYYFNKGANNGNMWVSFYDIEKRYINVAGSGNGVIIGNSAYTTPDNCHYMKFFLSAQTEYQHDVAINYPSTDHNYHPYVGRTIPISWQTEAGTVYGGKLDVLSGVLRVERIGVDLSTLSWSTKATGTTHKSVYATLPKAYVGHPRTSENIFNPILEKYTKSGIGYYSGTSDSKITNPDAQDIGCLYYSNSNNTQPSTLYLILDVNDTPSGWLVYNTADVTEYQLDAHTINSLYGVNNIFADTGDTHAEYRADPTLYIQRLTEPDADMIADANITSGKYFMVGNNLYKATANIASGASVIVGTNATRKSLAQALNEINA